MNDDLPLALELADIADRIAMSRFRASDLEVEIKPDGSPVTDADGTIERDLRVRLAEARPDHAVLGEEFGASGDSPWCWHLDPIDGTGSFLAGKPEWYVLIALVHDGVPILGVASAPALDSRWWAARGQGAFRDGRRLRVSATRRLAEATLGDDWHRTLERGLTGQPINRIAAACARVRPYAESCVLAVAEAESDIALGVGGYPWDHAALKVIVEEAGGRFTDLHGSDAIDTRHCLASNGRLHEEALAILADGIRD
ncbi:MAG TPA: inositol monophosphatase family protein [Solirubrobacteraceae bacterium]